MSAQIRFNRTWNGARVETNYGGIYEHAPLLGDIYELHFESPETLLFKNITQPHHTIMWWLEIQPGHFTFGSSGGASDFVGSVATFEVLSGSLGGTE